MHTQAKNEYTVSHINRMPGVLPSSVNYRLAFALCKAIYSSDKLTMMRSAQR